MRAHPKARRRELTAEYGRGFERRKPSQTIRFAELLPDEEIVQTLSAHLSDVNIGKRMGEDVLKNKRANYCEQIVSALSAQLTAEFGRGFGRRNLLRMTRFAEVFPDEQIVQSVMTQLRDVTAAGLKNRVVHVLTEKPRSPRSPAFA